MQVSRTSVDPWQTVPMPHCRLLPTGVAHVPSHPLPRRRTPLTLAACATTPSSVQRPAGPVEVQILAINDFHGNLEPPNLTVPAADGAVPAGGRASGLAGVVAGISKGAVPGRLAGSGSRSGGAF